MNKDYSHGIIYRWVWVYRLLMRALYGLGYYSKYQAVVDLIPPGSSVVDLCAGDCVVAPLLKSKNCSYIALDLNDGFLSWAKEQNIDARHWNGYQDNIPEADVVCMQSSLYHFIENDRALLENMLHSARLMVIISEPVHNLSAEKFSIAQFIARKLTVVSGREYIKRYNDESLDKLMKSIPGGKAQLVRRGRDALYIIKKNGR